MASEVHEEISNGNLKENIEIEPLGETNVKAKSAEALIVDLVQSECSADGRKDEEVEEPTREEKQEPLATTLEKEKDVHEVGEDEEEPQEGNGYSVEEEVEGEVNEREAEGQYEEEEEEEEEEEGDDEEEYEEGKDDDEDEEAEPPSKRRK